jgi:UDPglucose--hexose-1-phosphate uridylyltransferase
MTAEGRGAWFEKKVETCRYLNPLKNFQENEVTLEVRRDGITGTVSRVLPYRGKRKFNQPDAKAYLEKSPESLCPFCPALLDQIATRFTPEIFPEGRLTRGRAVLFPNAFPHDAFNTVAVISEKHYLALDELTPEVMRDAFALCLDYFRKMNAARPDLNAASINWNYMPPSGGGLLHPHLQTVLGERPTRYVGRLRESAEEYERRTGGSLWRDLVADESGKGVRHIARTGAIDWLAAFAPRGMAGEVRFVFSERNSLFALTGGDWGFFFEGLSRIFRYLKEAGIVSFNLAICGALRDDSLLAVQGSVIPRFAVPPLGASDINYFEKLHDEIICPVVPENLCAELRPYFSGL